MAIAKTKTLLSLDRWAQIIGVHPLHFNQIEFNDAEGAAQFSTCGSPTLQYGWQHADKLGREEIAQAIAMAEERISEYLNSWVAPTWTVDERQPMIGDNDPSSNVWTAAIIQRSGLEPSVKTRWGNLIAAGVEARTPISGGATVVYSDTDNDGWKETATIQVATTVTKTDELAVFYPGHQGEPEYQIRPLKSATILGGTPTITLMRSQLLKEEFFEGLSARGVNGSDDGAFLTTVDVGRHWHDPSQQAHFLWEATGNGCGCGQITCTSCFLLGQFGCAHVRSYRQGFMAISPANWNSTTEEYEGTSWAVGRKPDRVRLWYRSGVRYTPPVGSKSLPGMDPKWERAVAYYSVGLMDRGFCECDNIQALLKVWREDLSQRTSNNSGSSWHDLAPSLRNNPLGTTMGAVNAWRIIQRDAIGEAVIV